MNYTIVEEGNYYHKNQNDKENDWGFFVELDDPIYLNPIKFKYPKKYFHFSIPQTLATIKEDMYEDLCCLENGKNDDEKDDIKKKAREYAITSQIYSGIAICILALYICLNL
jgi:hypothetical protein